MRKQDPEFTENADRTENDRPPVTDDRSEGALEKGEGVMTVVKNASASGLGTMGRSDEKIPDENETKSEQAY